MTDPVSLTQFRLEIAGDIAHLIFDCPGRTMNVFSDAAIVELGRIAAWLPDAPVRGLVIRSGKTNAFCAGADLTELGVADDMIMAAPRHARFRLAADHFFRLGAAMRALETAGKPVAAAIAGLALGGGCELALAAHHRVLVDDPRVAMGLPESLVGLLPGAGGTQRLPRLIGPEAALPILLDGARLAGKAALDTGLVDALCAPGEEIAAAEAWIRSDPDPRQLWDRDDHVPLSPTAVDTVVAPVRQAVLRATRGHYPAPLAILDCVAFGLPQSFEGAIRTENAIFADLIQREEPRNMIATMFLAKTEYERLLRRDALPPDLTAFIDRARALVADRQGDEDLRSAGFFAAEGEPVRTRPAEGYWIDGDAAARKAVDGLTASLVALAPDLPGDQRALADYASIIELGYPAYLGGPFARAARAATS